MTFRVGMKVVAVGNDKRDSGPRILPLLPRGGIYTVRDYDIRGVSHAGHDCATLRLEEVRGPEKFFSGFGVWETGYRADCFRPLTDTKTETSFTTGADPDSEQYDNRRRIPVSEWGCSA